MMSDLGIYEVYKYIFSAAALPVMLGYTFVVLLKIILGNLITFTFFFPFIFKLTMKPPLNVFCIHIIYSFLTEALKEVADIATQLQSSLIRLENFQKLTELQRDLIGIENLTAPGRVSAMTSSRG